MFILFAFCIPQTLCSQNFLQMFNSFVEAWPISSKEEMTTSVYETNANYVEGKIISRFVRHQNHAIQNVTQAQLDNIWPDKSYVLRVQIVKQRLYAHAKVIPGRDLRYRINTMLSHLQHTINRYVIRDVDFILHLHDVINNDYSLNIPTFKVSINTGSSTESNLFLLPDFYMIDKMWNKTVNSILHANNKYSWENKESKIFWRGASTGAGGLYSIKRIEKFPRLKLVILSTLYPDLIDAKFSNFAQFEDSKDGVYLKKVLNQLPSGKIETKDESEHLRYKYLISLDGNTCAWKRVPWILLSNSVLLKQETSNIQWFYPALKPYVHYIPLNESITDIFQQLDWMKRNDDKVKEISKNAQIFALNHLLPHHIQQHTSMILNEYHRLHAGATLKATLPPASQLIEKLTLINKKG